MAYEKYSGQSIGRQLHFLYRYTMQADEAIFQGDGTITLFNRSFVEKVEWNGDIPTFTFSPQYQYLEDEQKRYLEHINE